MFKQRNHLFAVSTMLLLTMLILAILLSSLSCKRRDDLAELDLPATTKALKDIDREIEKTISKKPAGNKDNKPISQAKPQAITKPKEIEKTHTQPKAPTFIEQAWDKAELDEIFSNYFCTVFDKDTSQKYLAFCFKTLVFLKGDLSHAKLLLLENKSEVNYLGSLTHAGLHVFQKQNAIRNIKLRSKALRLRERLLIVGDYHQRPILLKTNVASSPTKFDKEQSDLASRFGLLDTNYSSLIAGAALFDEAGKLVGLLAGSDAKGLSQFVSIDELLFINANQASFKTYYPKIMTKDIVPDVLSADETLKKDLSKTEPSTKVNLELEKPLSTSNNKVKEPTTKKDISQKASETLWLGLQVQEMNVDLLKSFNLSETLKAVLIGKVHANSPGERAGIYAGDIVVKMAGISPLSIDQLPEIMNKLKPGMSVDLLILRNGQELKKQIIAENRQ